MIKSAKPMLAVIAVGGSFALWAAMPAAPSHAAAPHAGISLCQAGERVLYACAFPRGAASLCLGAQGAHYRFGRPGQIDLDLASAPDWSNVHTGMVIGQGGGSQSHVRFTKGQTHYIIFDGETGSLADHPGQRLSGIAVQQGAKGEKTLATLDCKGGPRLDRDGLLSALSRLSPGPREEERDGPFDAWF